MLLLPLNAPKVMPIWLLLALPFALSSCKTVPPVVARCPQPPPIPAALLEPPADPRTYLCQLAEILQQPSLCSPATPKPTETK